MFGSVSGQLSWGKLLKPPQKKKKQLILKPNTANVNGSRVPSPSSHLLYSTAQPSLSLTDTPPLSLPHSSSSISFDQRNYTLQSPLLPLSGSKKKRKERETESQGEASCQLKTFLNSLPISSIKQQRVKRKQTCMKISSHFYDFSLFIKIKSSSECSRDKN